MPVPDSWRMAPLPMPAMRPIHIPDPPPNPTQITMSLYKDRNHKDNSTDGEPPCKRPCTIKEDQVLGSKIDQRRLRFLRTRYALEKSGLMEITMRTAVLLKSNNLLDQEISKLREETKALLEALMQNQQTNTVSDSWRIWRQWISPLNSCPVIYLGSISQMIYELMIEISYENMLLLYKE